jgi:GalNAc-alpha-(1->4)-GalNAc-alpha-(1->3)-diNAcBac-PP-undecaprenol alpha-1,4-N-acetyl-D-galactosaminyltransferase
MRITLVIHSLAPGGAERVLSIMANYWAAKGWDITVLTLAGDEMPPFYHLDGAVKYRPLGIAGASSHAVDAMRNSLSRASVLRRAIKESSPDAAISFIDVTNVTTLLATRGMNIPVIVSERTDPFVHRLARPWGMLRKLLYPWATAVVAQNEHALSYFSAAVQRRGRVIPNPVVLLDDRFLGFAQFRPTTSSPESSFVHEQEMVISVGRLSHEKGFDMLLEAFARVSGRHPGWTLEIWGEGPLRSQLEAQAIQLGIQDRIRLPGRTTQPYDKMRSADLFVLSSRFEGFPNALCEAMACGVAVISFDCPGGPREIIRHNVDGLLVPRENIGALAQSIDKLMSSPAERQRLAERAPEVLVRFNLEKVMRMWEDLLAQTIGARIAESKQTLVGES